MYLFTVPVFFQGEEEPSVLKGWGAIISQPRQRVLDWNVRTDLGTVGSDSLGVGGTAICTGHKLSGDAQAVGLQTAPGVESSRPP